MNTKDIVSFVVRKFAFNLKSKTIRTEKIRLLIVQILSNDFVFNGNRKRINY